MSLTRQKRVDSLSVACDLLVKERLSMEVDTLEVFGRTHVDQVPAHKLLGIHPQALQVVNNAIDGLGYKRQKKAFYFSLCQFSVLLTHMKERVLQFMLFIHNSIF